MVKSRSIACGVVALCAVGIAASGPAPAAQDATRAARERVETVAPQASHAPAPGTIEAAQAVVTRTCTTCHNDRTRAGALSLTSFTVATAGQQTETTEKMIRKLRAGQMPPAGIRRDEAVLSQLA